MVQPVILQKCRPPCSMHSPLRLASLPQFSRRHLVVRWVLAVDVVEHELSLSSCTRGRLQAAMNAGGGAWVMAGIITGGGGGGRLSVDGGYIGWWNDP